MVLFGNALIFVALIASIMSAVRYSQAALQNPAFLNRARRWFAGSAIAVVAMSALLLTLLLRHDFSNGYVYSYSSRDLPLHFLLSSFYAGQEGSFLFWVLCSLLIGIALIRYSARKRSEAWVMTVFMGVQAMLLLLVYAKTPFKSVWELIPQIPAGKIPVDGSGLNPLLQNFWMVIHPPVLFVGFAAMAVPFSFAVASMWKRDFALLSSQTLGWLLFSVLILGCGIMLGAYWAYGVLGWGGYWGWDPVENSSLVPWLTGVALVHTLVVQRRTGKFLRLNLTLAIVSFLLVVYSTFLTRSGVLGDSSVHAFVDAGAGVYWILLAFLLGIAAIGFGFMYVRRRELRPARADNQLISRESALALGAIALVLSAAVILFGTSLPLSGTSTVDTAFYDTMNLPLVIAMVLIIGLSLYTQWGRDVASEIAKRSLKWSAVSVLGAGTLFALGIHDLETLVLVAASLFAILVNIEFGWKQVKVSAASIGGKLAHVGVAVFLLGVIASGRYNSTRQLALKLNQPQKALGHTITYMGYHPTPDGKFSFNVQVEQDGKMFQLSPIMFDAGRQGMMRNPDIASFITSDFYVSPVSLQETQPDPEGMGEEYTLEKGKTISVGEFKATFIRFDMGTHAEDNMMNGSGNGMAVGSVLELSDGKAKETIVPVTVYGANGRQTSKPSTSRLMNANIRLVSMNVGGMGGQSTSTVTIGIHREQESPQNRQTLIVEASVKPFISLVWAGALVMFLGFAMAGVVRLRGT